MQPSKPARSLISRVGWVGLIAWLAAAFVLLQLLHSAQLKAPLFGTRIPLGAGLNAVAQVIMIVSLLIGWHFARVKAIRKHRRIQTTVVMVNWLAILFVMGVTFFGPEVLRNPRGASDLVVLFEMGHGGAGMLAAVLGGYLVVRMAFERVLPDWFQVKNFRRLMRITIVIWLLIGVGGLGLFTMKYLLPSSAPAAVVASPPTQAAPPAPSPTTIPLPTPTPTEVTGQARIDDNRADSDRISIDLFNVPPSPSDEVYRGWLIGNHGLHRLDVGFLRVGSDGRVSQTFTSPIEENLFADYDEFIVSLERVSNVTQQLTGAVRFSAVIPLGAGQGLRTMLVSAPDTPHHVAYLIGLRKQADVVMAHVSLTHLFVDSEDIVSIHRHAEQMVNTLEGAAGKHFGDVDGDGRILNPGDGFGLLPSDRLDGYINAVRAHAEAAARAPDAIDQIKVHARHVVIAMDNAQRWAVQLDAKALELAQANDTASTQAILLEMQPLAKNLINGVDVNGNGVVEPIEGEGTVLIAYTHAQFALSPAYNSPLVEGGAPVDVPQATPTPTPPPPTATPPPAPNVVRVLIKDFVFDLPTITIRAGTTVEFINLDNAPHSATLDDASQDTGTLNLNDRARLTFEKPGEFGYYCLFHGGPGGVGMAAKIVVTP